MVDDIDGGAADQTVPFALDGVNYEIDLSAANAGELRELLQHYVDAGRRVGGRKIRVALGQSTVGGGVGTATVRGDRERNQQVRAWAQENGYAVAERGRIPNEVFTAFEAAEAEPAVEVVEEPKKRAPRRKKVAA
jgi:hypothetical protein